MTKATSPLTNLSQKLARRILEQLGSSGQPPEDGIQYFSVGLEPYLNVIVDEYLNDYIADGGASFKMVVGIYGGGKTHFLYSVRDQAWAHNYAIAYVSLKASGECPFHQLDLVYRAIVTSILPPMQARERNDGAHGGIDQLLKHWYGTQYQQLIASGMSHDAARQQLQELIHALEIKPSISFRNAVLGALQAHHNGRGETFQGICQWLLGEGLDRRVHAPHNIQQKIDRTTAMPMIRSLGSAVRELGYQGLIVLLDEAERIPSLSARNREQHLSNLRELIDECSRSTFSGMMMFYAVPDESFLDGRTQVYEALNQRLSTTFSTINPTGTKILLEKTVGDHKNFLTDVGGRLADIYEIAYKTQLHVDGRTQLVEQVALWAQRERFGDEGYKRLFVQRIIPGLRILHREQRVATVEELTEE